jgi:NADPH-dependent 2,4-dienoyl-CoA reductase/sulfur reductase-like enzyme/rhodanese-related sulfurtransferase
MDSNQPLSNRPFRIVIVGGVAGGASAATRARRVNADAEITILEKGPAVSFANCGLPYHVGGEIADRAKLLVATPELFWNRFRIEVKLHHEVFAIDRTTRTVRVACHNPSDGSASETVIPYDRLILATGAEPVRPPFATEMPRNAFHLWTLSDMDLLMAFISANSVKRALVIGAGFVGVEVVEQFHRCGLKVDLVERNPQVLTRLDPIFASIVSKHMESQGVRVLTGESVASLEKDGDHAKAAILESGKRLETDLIVIGAGVRPRTALASGAELAIGPMGGIVVNEFMQTSDTNIYAVGDAVEYTHAVTGKRGLNPLAGPANRSGRIAGEHAARGNSQSMGGVLGTSIVRVFELTAASTGLNELQLTKNAIPFRTAIVQAASHASYFPGAQSMQLKLLYAPTDGRILGGQAVGGEGVDKRIDILATAMAFRGTVYDLAKLDLAYAPPYGSAKDPIHMAAFTAINDLTGAPNLVPPDCDLAGNQVVDVRTDREREQLPLPGAVAIEIDRLADRWQELDPQLPTVVVCHSGKRAHIAACWLASKGFQNVANLTGGMSIRAVAQALPKR